MLRKKDRAWLEKVRDYTDAPLGRYAGLREDMLPAGPSRRLQSAGLIEYEMMSNPAHRGRYTIRDAGRRALAEEARDG